MDQALSGVRVISFAQLAQGPQAIQMLGDMGADVIKIERPVKGEFERQWTMLGEFVNGESVSFWAYNRNKRSVTLNLKAPEAKEIVHKLVKTADVVVENFRPGVMDRLGFGYDDLARINPRIIYASGSGFGPDGPYRDKAGQDLVVQAMGGLASLTGRGDGPPVPVGTNIADMHSASLLAFGIMVALFHQQRTGRGQKVEVNLLNSMLDLQGEEFAVYMNTGKHPTRSQAGLAHPYMEAPYGIFATADGYIALSMTPLPRVLEAMGEQKLLDRYSGVNDSMARRDEIARDLGPALRKRSTREWLDLFEERDIWCGPVHDYAEVLQDPQVKHNEIVITVEHEKAGPIRLVGFPIKLSATPASLRLPPPVLGAHTREVLTSIGYTDTEIDALAANGVL